MTSGRYYIQGFHLKSKFSPCIPCTCLILTTSHRLIINSLIGINAGMTHLHSNQIIHRDLAARNILIQMIQTSILEAMSTVELIPKISDFGLSTSVKEGTPIPIRWSSPEVFSLNTLK